MKVKPSRVVSVSKYLSVCLDAIQTSFVLRAQDKWGLNGSWGNILPNGMCPMLEMAVADDLASVSNWGVRVERRARIAIPFWRFSCLPKEQSVLAWEPILCFDPPFEGPGSFCGWKLNILIPFDLDLYRRTSTFKWCSWVSKENGTRDMYWVPRNHRQDYICTWILRKCTEVKW